MTAVKCDHMDCFAKSPSRSGSCNFSFLKKSLVLITCFVQCIIKKKLLHSVFVIPRIIKVSVRVIITPTLTLIILDITKASSNNCLQMASKAIIKCLFLPVIFLFEKCMPFDSLSIKLLFGDNLVADAVCAS